MSLTVKEAGHSRRVGTKQLGGIGFGALLLLLYIYTLQSKLEFLELQLEHITKYKHTMGMSMCQIHR